MLRLVSAALLVLPLVPPVPPDSVQSIDSALRARQFEQALELSKAALQRNPNDAQLLFYEGIALNGLNRANDALAALTQALQLSPDYLPALELAAQLQYQARSDQAVPLLDRILVLRPSEQTAHAMRGTIAWERHDCGTAVDHFSQSTRAIANQPSALHAYGGCLATLNQLKSAATVFASLVALTPQDGSARRALAEIQLSNHEPRATLDTLRPLLDAKTRDTQALRIASAAYELIGDTPRAVQTLRNAMVAAPGDTDLYLDFTQLALDHNSFQVGVDMLNRGIERSPQAAQLYAARGVLYVQLAQYEKADQDFAMAEKLDPGQTYGSVARGMAEIQQSDLDRALATIQGQLEHRPDDAFLHYMLGQILSSKGARPGSPAFQRALAAGLRAVQLKPDFVLARDLLSRLYLESGQNDEAIAQCRQALRDDPSDSMALYRLIRALQKSGSKQDTEQVPALLQRFSALRQELQKKEMEQSRYRLIEPVPAERNRP